jgi:hypothetical protein
MRGIITGNGGYVGMSSMVRAVKTAGKLARYT